MSLMMPQSEVAIRKRWSRRVGHNVNPNNMRELEVSAHTETCSFSAQFDKTEYLPRNETDDMAE